MAALRELEPQFGGDHTAPAVSGITGDSNSQAALPCRFDTPGWSEDSFQAVI